MRRALSRMECRLQTGARTEPRPSREIWGRAASNVVLSRFVRCLASLLWVSLILATESSRSVAGPSATTVLPALRRATAAQPHPGFTPSQIRHFYGIDRLPFDGRGQTIAVVGTGVSPTVGSDLAVFSQAYGLPQLNGLPRRPGCTVQNGPHPCFQHLAPSGTSSYAAQWAIETALGVEWAHAIAPGADILLVESPSGNLTDMLAAVDVAVRSGAHVVAMSWGAAEFAGERSYDHHFAVPGVAFVAPAGDLGAGTLYPAVSPYVVAVGGTTLDLGQAGAVVGETAWIGSGGGASKFEPEPAFQRRADLADLLGRRLIPDVAFAANPRPGFSVYESRWPYGDDGWFRVGGTSAGVPQWAAIIALADQARGHPVASSDLEWSPFYAAAACNSCFRDVTVGSNGDCTTCKATVGYDLVTGLGAPRARNLVRFLAGKRG